MGRSDLQKPCSGGLWWAREEVNLRPLPGQIQRASTGLYVRRLETGNDHEEAAGERRCQRPAAPTIRHHSPTVVLIPTAVACCPSAARRAKPDLRDHNLNLPSVLSQLLEPKGPQPAVPPNRGRPLVTAHGRARSLRHGPSADRPQQNLLSLSPTPPGRQRYRLWRRGRCYWPGSARGGMAP